MQYNIVKIRCFKQCDESGVAVAKQDLIWVVIITKLHKLLKYNNT